MRTFMLSIVMISLTATAKTMKTGIQLGYSLSTLTASQQPLLMNGTGLSGGIAFSFFEDKRFGFRMSSNCLNLSASGSSKSIIGWSWFHAATLNVNFDFSSNRHSLGIGYGTSFVPTGSFQGGSPVSNNFSGIVVDGKDFWKSGFYDLAQIYIFRDSSSLYSNALFGVLSIGYEF